MSQKTDSNANSDARLSGRSSRKIAERKAARNRKLAIFSGVISVAVVAAIVLILVSQTSSSSLPAVHASTISIDPSIPQDGRTLGDPNAKVSVVEWGDYQCIYCTAFAKDAESTIFDKYVKTGEISFTFKNFAFIDDDSVRAAQAAACALDQGKFWDYHVALYSNNQDEKVGTYSDSRLKQLAKIVGLDTDKFNSCYDSKTHADEITSENQQARQLGVNSTPSFQVNGTLTAYGGIDDLEQKIDAAIAQAG